MATPSNFKITPFGGGLLENVEFEFQRLYLHHVFSGPRATQANIVEPDVTTGWGRTVVNNWPIYDGIGPDAKLVGRAQGLHIDAGNWHNCFTLRFEIARFKESTLQVTGGSVEKQGEWAIVGGTGDFAMACGIVKRKVHGVLNGGEGEILELTIHGFCRMESLPQLTKSGPWGGNGGSARDSEEPRRIETITIVHQGVIGLFECTYVDRSGNRRTTGPWGGGTGTNRSKVELGPNEVVKEVSGTYFNHNNGSTTQTVVQSLKFVTNEKTYGPYGRTTGTPFSADVPKDKSVAGFFGRTDNRYLNAIGVYMV